MPRRARLLPRLPLLLALVLGGFSAPAPLTHAQQSDLPDMRWVSPTWGYIIRWHSNEWSVAEDESVDGADTLTLTDSLGNSVTFTGQRGEGGDAEACLDDMVATAQDTPGAVDFEIAQDDAGAPYEWRTPEQAYVVFYMSVPGDDGVLQDYVAYAECQTLVPGEAVFQRGYSGPPEVFDQWFDDIVKTLEGVYLPPSAWLPYDPDVPWLGVHAGKAPLLEQSRINAAFDDLEKPRLLVGLEAEAGDTRLVSFTNAGTEPVTVNPADVTLTLYTIDDDAEGEVWPLADARWEDGAAADPDGARVLAPGEQASVVLDFVPGDLSTTTCDDFPILLLAYEPADRFVEFAESALPGALGACPTADPGQPAVDGPAPQPAPTVDVPSAPALDVMNEALLEAALGQLDQFGRVPLARLSFAPGAALPDDFLRGPLVAIVESGAFEVAMGATLLTLPAGQAFTADENAVLAVRNSGDDAPGTLLVLPLSPSEDWGTPLVESPPPGISFDLLFPEQDLLKRSAPQQFAIERVVLSPGDALAVRDRGGPALEYTALLVESGSVVTTDAEDAADEGTTVAVGAAARVPAGALIQAAADQPAELLIVDVLAAADQSAEQPDALTDTSYTSPTWGYTIHWDADAWSMEQETSENGTDLLTLRDDAGNIAAFMGNLGYGGNATACLESMKASVWQIPGATDYALAVNESDEPFEFRGPTQAYAFYTMRLPDDAGGMEETYFYDECQTLVAGEAVFQRSYFGPAAVYFERQTAIIDVLEGVFLPASAWLAHVVPYDPDFEYGSTGGAPLLGKFVTRSNATIVHDDTGNPVFLVGLVHEAGDSRLVTFENLSDSSVLVEPEKIVLTIASRTDPADEEVLPLLSVAWQDGAPAETDGARLLEVGERATALLTFAAPPTASEACQEMAFTMFMYPWLNDANEERGFFGYGELPACAAEGVTDAPALGDPLLFRH